MELFDADADIGVADVVPQRGELRLADLPAGLLQPLDDLGQPSFQGVEASRSQGAVLGLAPGRFPDPGSAWGNACPRRSSGTRQQRAQAQSAGRDDGHEMAPTAVAIGSATCVAPTMYGRSR